MKQILLIALSLVVIHNTDSSLSNTNEATLNTATCSRPECTGVTLQPQCGQFQVLCDGRCVGFEYPCDF